MILTLICKVAYFRIQNKTTQAFKVNWINFIPETTFIYLTEAGGSMLKGTYIYINSFLTLKYLTSFEFIK